MERFSHEAFAFNQLTSLPEKWPEGLTTFESGVFSNNQLTSLPEKWPEGLKKVERFAFGNNQLTPGMSFYINPQTLTQEFLNDLNSSNVPLPIYLYTTDDTPPAALKVPDGIFINKVDVTVNFVDTSGALISDPVTVTGTMNEKFTYTPPAIYGYSAPMVEETLGKERNQTVTVMYDKIDTSKFDNTAQMELKLKNKDSYEIGKDMTGSLRIQYTGYDSQPLANPRVEIKFDPAVYSEKDFDITTRGLNIDESTIVRKPGVFSFTLPILNPGQTVEIPLRARFNKFATPSNTEFPLTATLVTSPDGVDGNMAVAQSNTESFRGHYKSPYERVTVQGEHYDGLVPNYDQKVISSDAANPVSFVADNEPDKAVNNTLKYDISVYDLERNISGYQITVPLPQYSVHEKSETFKTTGPVAYAVFDPSINPGWELSADGRSVTFTGDNKATANVISKPLILGYPGAVEGDRIPLTATVVMHPTGQATAEPDIVTVNGRTNHFARFVPQPGKLLGKFASGNHGGMYGNYFYDNDHERSGTFSWAIAYNADQNLNDVVFRDYDLDPRMFYDSVTVPANLGDVTVRVVDSRGADLQSYEISGELPRR